MPSQNEVEASSLGCFPDARVVSAQDLDITVGDTDSLGTGQGDDSRTMRDPRAAGMNPCAAAFHDSLGHAIEAHRLIVVAAHGIDRCDFPQRAHQIAQLAQLRRPVDKITAQYQGIDWDRVSCFENLSTEIIRAPP